MRNIPRVIWYLALAAFLVRLVFFVVVLASGEQSLFLTGDSRGFLRVAENIRAGHGFSQSEIAPFVPDSRFPPVFSLVLGASLAAFDSFLPVIFLNMLLGSLLPLIAYRISFLFSENSTVSFITACATAFEPLTFVISMLLAPHALSLVFFLIATLYFMDFLKSESYRSSALSGAFLGIATLVRPHTKLLVGFALLFFLGYLWRRRNGIAARRVLASAGIFFAAVMLVFLPWMMRNYYHFRSLDISSTGLRNIYTDFAVSVLSYKTGEEYSEVERRLEEDFARERGISSSDINRDPQWGNELLREGVRIIIGNPKESLAVAAITLSAFFTQDLYMYFSQVFGLLRPGTIDFSPSVVLLQEGPFELFRLVWEKLGWSVIVPVAGRFIWAGTLVLALAGFVLSAIRGGRERMYALLLGFLILYHAATSLAAAFSAHGFHRYPVNVFLFLFAGYALVYLVPMLNRRMVKIRGHQITASV